MVFLQKLGVGPYGLSAHTEPVIYFRSSRVRKQGKCVARCSSISCSVMGVPRSS